MPLTGNKKLYLEKFKCFIITNGYYGDHQRLQREKRGEENEEKEGDMPRARRQADSRQTDMRGSESKIGWKKSKKYQENS